MVDLSSLNENQRTSVNWNNGPLLVLAGPGAGKTRILTYRIARLLEKTAGKHFRILGLTFTNRAAAEMRRRIERLVPNAGERTLLTTFHSFSAALLRQHGHHIGLRPDFTILAQPMDRESLLEEAIERTRQEHTDIGYRGEQLLPLITRLLDRNIAADQAIAFLQKYHIRDAQLKGTIYRQYRRLMIENNELDFGGLMAEVLRLFQEKSAIKRQIQRIYPYICVDEFQDTNNAQYQILKCLVNPSTKNLFVVADDDQIIYQWNGANPEQIQAIRDDFDMAVLQLPKNYRCPPAVIDIANKLIAHNPHRSPNRDALTAHKTGVDNESVTLKAFASLAEEAQWVATDIAQRPKNIHGKCVILARTRRVLEYVHQALQEQGVEGYLAIRKDEFVSWPMMWMHAMLRLANARQDRGQLRKICKSFSALEGIHLDSRNILSDASTEEGDYLRAWLRAILQCEQLDPKTKQFLERSVPKLTDTLDFKAFTKESFAWFEQLTDIDTEYQDEKQTWHNLVQDISGGRQEPVTLHVLLQELGLHSKAAKPAQDAVSCFTIHASKGMEFDHVYLVGLVEDQLPSWHAIKKGDDSPAMQEERRNCFVAITRVQESLTLTYAHEVFEGGTKNPSRFLQEMGLVP